MERLQSQTGSTSTLLRGMAMCSMPLADLLQVKDEPDDEEAAMQAEMQEMLRSETGNNTWVQSSLFGRLSYVSV